MQVIIDGHNVMFAWEGVRQACLKNPQAGRRLVVEAAERYQAQRQGRKVTVVFDGKKNFPTLPYPQAEGGVKVIYSKPPMDADLVIRELVEVMQGKEEVWVVSSDREVQDHAKTCGARVFGAKAFEGEMRKYTPHPTLAGKGGGAPHSKPLPQEEKRKPTRVRQRDVDFWLKAMQGER